MNSSEVLRVHNLTKKFPTSSGNPISGKIVTAVDHVSFSIQKGEIVGLLGQNGAGKTTIIQMLLSVLTPTSGSIFYFGQDLFKHRSAVLQRISFASSYVQLPSELSVWTNLDIFGQMYGIRSKERAHQIERLLKFFGMWNLAHKRTGGLSAGQMTRVMLAKAFVSNPELIILDEPTASLDPEISHEVREFIHEQNKRNGVSLLITSHNMEEVAALCSRVLILKKGSIIANDTPTNLAHTIAQSRVEFTTQQCEPLIAFLTKQGLEYSQEHNTISVVVQESQIPAFFCQLTKHGITYEHIGLRKPTLHDYFISITEEPV